MDRLTEAQWAQYEEQGYLALGKVVSDHAIDALRRRIDDIMLGKAAIDCDKLLMQLDSGSGEYGDLSSQTRGHKGATLNYRKIQDLEYDDLFWRYMTQPLFEDICTRQYGAGTPVDIHRAMFMNKPAGKGTFLPWHQDRWANLDRDPQVTIWTALDAATVANGCLEIIPGTHKKLINPDHHSGFLEEGMITGFEPESTKLYLELDVGEAVLLHNWLLHSSNRNTTNLSRRAFSVCYMDGNTQPTGSTETQTYNRIFPRSQAMHA